MGTTDEMESVDWRRFLSERDGQLDTCFPFGDPYICLAADEQDLSDDILAMMERLHCQPPCRTAVLMLEFVAENFSRFPAGRSECHGLARRHER